MLWKLLKYDFRSMWKQFAVVWPAVLVIGLVNRFTLPWEVTGSSAMANVPGAVGVTTVILLFAGLLAMGVLALVFILQRFYKGLLGDEGYLMHTLPVKPWQLVASKLICAVAMLIISGAVAFLAMLLMVPVDWGALFQEGILGDVIRWAAMNLGDVAVLLEIVLLLVEVLALMVLTCYAAMAVGHLFQRHRVAMSVVAFVVLDIVISNLTAILGRLAAPLEIFAVNSQVGIWAVILYQAVLGAALFAGATLVLSRRLNLE